MDSNVATMTPEAGSSAESGTTPQAARDAANRESLSRAYDAIEAREKAQERQPIIHDEARHVAKVIREVREDHDYRAEGLPVYQSGTPVTVLDSLHAAASRAEAREAEAKKRQMPSLPSDKSTRERLEASAKWMELSDSDKVAFRAGHDVAAEQKKAAEWFNMTPTEAKLVEIQAQLKGQDRVAPLMDRYARLVPGRPAEATMANAASWAEALQRDPKGAYRQLGERLGLGPIDLSPQQAQQQAAQVQQRAAQARQQAMHRAVSTAVDSFAASHPDLDGLQPRIVHALSSGAIKRSGNVLRDLQSAYRFAGGRYAV